MVKQNDIIGCMAIFVLISEMQHCTDLVRHFHYLFFVTCKNLPVSQVHFSPDTIDIHALYFVHVACGLSSQLHWGVFHRFCGVADRKCWSTGKCWNNSFPGFQALCLQNLFSWGERSSKESKCWYVTSLCCELWKITNRCQFSRAVLLFFRMNLWWNPVSKTSVR